MEVLFSGVTLGIVWWRYCLVGSSQVLYGKGMVLNGAERR